MTSRSQTGRQNILKNHDNRGFLLLVMNFQNYLSVTTKRSDRYLFPQTFFMRIPSKCYTTVFFTKVETVIIQLNLTCHFKEKIDLKTTTEIIPLHCCHHKTIENVLPISVCLIKLVGRAIVRVLYISVWRHELL